MTDSNTRLIAHTLPYPVARAICAIDAESAQAPERKLLHLLYALESLLQILGGVALVDAFEQARDVGAQSRLKKLRRDGHLSLGLWAWAITELAPHLPDPFVPELSLLARDAAFVAGLTRLADARNALAHPARAVDAGDARERLAALRPDFDALVRSVRFLGAYHLVGVTEPVQPVVAGARAMLVPLRGRRVASRDVALTFVRPVGLRDVLLLRPDLTSGLALHPFFTLAPPGAADDVLVLNRFDEAGLACYASSRPEASHREPPLRNDDGEALSPWDWLKSTKRRVLRVDVTSSADAVSLDGMRRLRRSQHGSDDLPLRDLRHLASGGMSEVYVGADPTSGVARVMKVAQDPSDRGARRHIEEEYRALSHVRHDAVVAVYACPTVEGLGPCLIEELFDHPTLQEHLSHGGLARDEAGALLRRLLDAVAALHAHGIVHRDLKPANILYDRATGAVKVIDLGIARRLDATSHVTTRVGHGTPAIMAPEQTRGGAVTPATDVYALGLTARALYCGLDSLGWPHDDHAVAAIPSAMWPVLQRATLEDPAARYADARAMLAAMDDARSTAPPAVEAPTGPRTARGDEERERLAAEASNLFRRATRRVASLRAAAGHMTAPDEFKKELRDIFAETQAALDALMARESLADPDELSRLEGLGTAVFGGGPSVGAGVIVLGAVAGVGGVLGPLGLVAGTAVGAAFTVAKRKQRFHDACDAATAALDDARRTVLAAIRAQ